VYYGGIKAPLPALNRQARHEHVSGGVSGLAWISSHTSHGRKEDEEVKRGVVEYLL